MPAAHGAHSRAPMEAAYLPEEHLVHPPAPTGVYAPRGQLVQPAAEADAYFPAAHWAHEAAPKAEYWPAPQPLQNEELSARVREENVPGGQATQLLEPAVDSKYPWPQLAQEAAPSAAEAVPAGQTMHAAASYEPEFEL